MADARDDPRLAAVLPNYRRWLHREVYRMSGDPDRHDDLVQEGMIAMWRALRTYSPARGSLPAWLNAAARRRLLDVLRGRPYVGNEGSGQGVAVADRTRDVASLSEFLAADAWAPEDLDAGDVLDALLVAYHDGEVAAAVDRLTPKQRRYVHLRFWQGMGKTELTEAFGYDPTGLWRTARRNLVADLGHLRELV